MSNRYRLRGFLSLVSKIFYVISYQLCCCCLFLFFLHDGHIDFLSVNIYNKNMLQIHHLSLNYAMLVVLVDLSYVFSYTLITGTAMLSIKERSSVMLTKDSKTVLYHLYKEYCLRRSNGLSRSASKEFDSSESVQKLLFPDWSVSDVDDCMCELGRNGYLDNHHASDFIYDSSLPIKPLSPWKTRKRKLFLMS